MKKIITLIKELIETLIGGELDRPVSFLKSAMITPFFVLKNEKSVKDIARQIKKSNNFNSICGLIDLQDGRDYIVRGRSRTSLNPITERNIKICLKEGVSPLIIIRNDWAVRRNQKFYVPSAEGVATNSSFYSNEYLEQEKKFVELLVKKFGNKIDIQISIEPDHPSSSHFALNLGSYLRRIGFKYKIIVNPIADAVNPHLAIKNQLNDWMITLSRSRNGNDFGEDSIINTDGNMSLSRHNIKEFMSRIHKDKRQYIIWTHELANTSISIPQEYL